MRISDWSSDVCSSDLLDPRIIADMNLHAHGPRIVERPYANFLPTDDGRYLLMGGGQSRAAIARFSEADAAALPDYERRLDAVARVLRMLADRPDRKSTRLNSSH